MANIAELGFSADTSDLKDASATLRAMVPVAAAAEKASEKLAKELDSAGSAAKRMASGTSDATTATAAAASGTEKAASAAGKVASANDKVASSAKAAAAGLKAEGEAAKVAGGQMQAYDAHVQAFHAANGRMKDGLADTSRALKFTAIDGLNASRQLADIGVTAAMGMSPFLIALQQGPQLFDILQNKAVMTGQTIGTVFRAAAAAIWAALAPLLPAILAVAAVAGTIAAGFALGARDINKSNKDIIGGLDLTEKQLERVKKAGVDTTVTLSDTFQAFFQVLGERVSHALDGPLSTFKKSWNDTLDSVTDFGRRAVRDIVGTFGGGYSAIIALWNNMPKTFAGIAALTGNAFISVFETLLNRIIGQINGINSKLNDAMKSLGIGFQFAMFDDVKLQRVANAEASMTADAIAKGYNEGYAKAGAATDRFFADVGKRAVANRRKAIKAAAGEAEKDASSKGKTNKPKADDPFIARDMVSSLDDVNAPANQLKITPDIRSVIPIRGLDEAIAKYREGVDAAKEIGKGFVNDLRGSLAQGEGLFKSFGNAVLGTLNRVFDKLLDKTLDKALEGLFSGGGAGGLFAGLFGGGGAFGSGGVQKFARGDMFDSPTAFRFGKGGANLGIMGEAGPEAVMPLQRGPDGSLGVQMYGGGGDGGSTFAPNVNVQNTYVLAGAMSEASVQRSIRESAEQTRNDVRKSIPSVLAEYQMNGTIAG